jgi:hypothetical protein
MASAISISRLHSVNAAVARQAEPERSRQTDVSTEEVSMLEMYTRYLASTRVRGRLSPGREGPAMLSRLGPVDLPAGRASFSDVMLREQVARLVNRQVERQAGRGGDPSQYMQHLVIQA